MKTITDKSIRFQLKEAGSDQATLINVVFFFDNKRFLSSTGQTIDPYQWDKERQRAHVDKRLIKNKRDRETNETINAHLERHRSALVKILNSLQLAGVPLDKELIKQHLDNALGRVKKVSPALDKPTSFADYLDQYIIDTQSGKRLSSRSRRYALVTAKGFRVLKQILGRYSNASGESIDFHDFTIEGYHRLMSWMTKQGLSLNYVGIVLKDLKLILKQSFVEGLHVNTVFQDRDFKRLVEEVDNIYLTSEELSQLYLLDLPANTRLDQIRDLFLIGCYTGLRFSDFSELRPDNITHNGQILTRKTTKTGERVSIPLNSNVLAILSKYGGLPPGTLTNQKMNEYLKKLCQKAGFDERVEVGRTSGGLRQTRILAKWELVTTHTARRSFATNAYLASVPTVAIMKITGHKTESSFMKYIKISSEQNALLLLDHPHFRASVDSASK